MLGFAWLALRQAQEALKNGRLEEAQRLLCQPAAHGHKRSWELLQQVANGYVERGERHLEHENLAAAWNDLVAAEQMGVADSAAYRLRQDLTRLGLAEVRTLLEASEPARALEMVNQLRHRSVQQAELPLLEEAAKSWALAKEQAGRGEFAQALQSAGRVRKLLPGQDRALEQFVVTLEHQHEAFSNLLVQLHEAAEQRQWREVVRLSEQVLAIAPQHLEARKARAQAWRVLEPETIASVPRVAEAAADPAAHPAPQQRFLLWIDGVGGYLVCLANRVTLGQATPDVYVDIPLFADVSRIHASLTRDVEGYLLEAARLLQVNGQTTDRALLQSGDRITLGATCQLQFRQPVPVSASARLDLASGHRLPLAVDGVLLMADTLVMGPDSQVHVPMPDLAQPIILYRHKDELGVRYAGNLIIDGRRCPERGLLRPNSTVTGDDFAFTIEPVGTELGRR
ncbi:MAG TPA: FHA domain-containing protein [Gemmataceae bacterium]|nr:FHA domain-containing protein [Gemmataceae bacterium]